MAEDNPQETSISTYKSNIDAAIKASQDGGALGQRVVEQLAERERKRRVDLLVKAFDKYAEMETTAKNLDKPDQVSFVAGAKSESYSQKRWSELEKAKKNLTKFSGVLEAALKGSYDRLEKAMNSGGKVESDDNDGSDG